MNTYNETAYFKKTNINKVYVMHTGMMFIRWKIRKYDFFLIILGIIVKMIDY